MVSFFYLCRLLCEIMDHENKRNQNVVAHAAKILS